MLFNMPALMLDIFSASVKNKMSFRKVCMMCAWLAGAKIQKMDPYRTLSRLKWLSPKDLQRSLAPLIFDLGSA